MLLPNEKRYHGIFRYESSKSKHGRITVPSELTKNNHFPFNNGDRVYITLREDGIILQQQGKLDLEPFIIEKECDSLDCDNNYYGVCRTRIKIQKGLCKNYIFNKNKFNKSLKQSVEGGKVIDKSKE